jgi:hypothetical protein
LRTLTLSILNIESGTNPKFAIIQVLLSVRKPNAKTRRFKAINETVATGRFRMFTIGGMWIQDLKIVSPHI